MMNRIKKEKINEHLNYLMCTMMIDEGVAKGKITPEELNRLRDVIEEMR
jgi:hypothetical protein